MEPGKQTSKEYFTLLTLLHTAMLVGQITFAIVAYYLNVTAPVSTDSTELEGVFRLLVPLFVIFGMVSSWLLSRKRLKTIRESHDLSEKLALFRVNFIIKLALLEAPSIFAIVGYLITGDLLFLALAGLILLIFILNRPTSDSVANDLELSHDERATLEDHEAVV